MARFKLLTYSAGGTPRAGIAVGETVYDAAELLAGSGLQDPGTTLGLLRQWSKALPLLERASAGALPASGKPLSGVELRAPILYPGSIFCIASNYYDHAREMNPEREPTREGKQPYFFLKPPVHTVIGPNEPIRVPGVSSQLDWEIELGAVIGEDVENLTLDNAMKCVAGYTIVNDLSLRDLGRRKDWAFVSDWFGQKVFEGAAPMGPWIVPASEIPDLSDVALKLWVNDELMQNSSTKNMIFNLPEQIEYLSRRMTLRPGDVIATGTPAGVGRPRGIYLKPGDRIRMEIAGIGSTENPVV
jgi:2-keto-4-pentenoate hydratase/2-oxohepta-3-ene-1,7-dioic acid hydratase in catechol pathway